MPAPGQQHSGCTTPANPFEDRMPSEERKAHINEYTAQQIATLQSRLDKQLGPEFISSRPGAAGQKVHYLAAEKCINLANDVFGFNGWSSAIRNIQIDFVDENSTGKVSLGLSVIVRVTLRDGTSHEDIGYGHIENCKGKAAAFEKAKKEGTTDALKRALRNFGNLLGNCIYDKDYLAKVTKLKIAPSNWDAENLHRHPDYVPLKKESLADTYHENAPMKREWLPTTDTTKPSGTSKISSVGELDDEFGSDEFDEADFSVSHEDHPDEVVLESAVSAHIESGDNVPTKDLTVGFQEANNRTDQQLRPPHARAAQAQPVFSVVASDPQTPLTGRTSTMAPPTKIIEAQNSGLQNQQPLIPSLRQQGHSAMNLAQPPPLRSPPDGAPGMTRGARSLSHLPAPQCKMEPENTALDGTLPLDSSSMGDHEPPVGFFTARFADSIQNGGAQPSDASLFNPHLESPSIRKTAGVDHTKTKPVGREAIGTLPVAVPPRTAFINPQIDKTRRVGMPVGAGSPLQNRSSYKPPQMKRPAESNGHQYLRPALSDVTSALVNNVPPDGGGDAKRQKTGTTQGIVTHQGVWNET
ncbi:DNA repair protein rad52 [Toensbergia leucococca]|nr:DNA repair protein rad52 [Toensbergia leucococca]